MSSAPTVLTSHAGCNDVIVTGRAVRAVPGARTRSGPGEGEAHLSWSLSHLVGFHPVWFASHRCQIFRVFSASVPHARWA